MKWAGNSLRLRHLHLQGWEVLMIMHNIAQPKQNVSDNCGCSVFKMKLINSLCLFPEQKGPKLQTYRTLQHYNHLPQKSIPSLESTPFLAKRFSCLPKPVLLCSSSLKMFDNAVNGASKPKFVRQTLQQMDISAIFLGHVGVCSIQFP